MDKKQGTENVSNQCVWGILLFESCLKYKQGFGNGINRAHSEMRFRVAHPNERGTNIALIILPHNKSSISAQRS